MIVLKGRALACRIAGMLSVGWDCGDDPQADWMEFLTSVFATCDKITYGEFSIMLSGSVSPQAIRRDVCLLKINRPASSFLRAQIKTPQSMAINEYCRRTGANYNTIYSRIRKNMANGMVRADAVKAALSTEARQKKTAASAPRRQIIKGDPRSMTKAQRREYLVQKAKAYGLLRTTPSGRRHHDDILVGLSIVPRVPGLDGQTGYGIMLIN